MPSEPPPAGHTAAAATSPVEGGIAAEPPRRLHPFTLVRGIDPRVLLNVVPAVAVGLFQLRDLSPLVGIVVVAGVAAVALLIAGTVRFLAWQRHTYEITAEAVVERQGVLNRRERTVRLERLQQVEIDQTLLDRFVGTAVLRLETAADSGQSELELVVVSLEEAQRLRAGLLARSPETGDAPVERRQRSLVEVPLVHVALAAVTGRRLAFIPVLLGAVLAGVGDVAGGDATDGLSDVILGAGTVVLALALVALVTMSVIVALVMGLLRDGRFRIREVGDELVVTRGLLSTREAVVPRARLQKVSVERGWLRRSMGFASLTLHSAGGDGAKAGQAGGSERRLTVPLLASTEVEPLVHGLLPGLGPLPELRAHPPIARRRARIRHALAALPLVPALGALGWVLSGPGVAAAGATAGALLAGSVGWWLGGLSHEHRGSAIGERWVVARSGALSISDDLAPLDKAQATSIRSDPFQRRRGLVTLVVSIAGPGGGITMLDLGTDRAVTWRDAVDRRWGLPGPGSGG